jgi:signal transduction histidine kinase
MHPDLKAFLISRSLEGIVTTDLAGNIIDCNETVFQILGCPEGSLKDAHISAIFPAPSASHLLPNLMHLARETTGFDGEIMLQAAGGEQVMVRLVAQAWPDKEPNRLLFRFLDWREIHEIVRQLRESNQMAVLGDLTRSLSHELLNPIAVIGTYTRRLLDPGNLGTDREEWARQVMSSVDRLEDMIETVQAYLDLPSPRFVEGSLDEILDRSLEKIRARAEENGVRIKRDGKKRLPGGFVDPKLLETAFTAVLVNALERMPDGGDLVLIRDISDGQGAFLIQDTGPFLGIKQIEEDLSPVHLIGGEQFHLNLAIARRIIDEHGGRFSLESSGSEGLTVRIVIPTDRRTVARNREL